MNTIFSLPMDIYKNRRLVAKLAKNDFKTRYAGSYLGMVWAMIQPIITVVVYPACDHDPGILVCILCRFSFRNRGSGSSFCSLSGSRYCSMVLFPGCADGGDKFSAGIQLSGKKSRF